MAMFKGFKPQAIQKIANSMGYQGPMQDFDSYLEQNPDKKREMVVYEEAAKQMARGGVVKMLQGGDIRNGREYVSIEGPGAFGTGFFRNPNQGALFTNPVSSEPTFRQPGDMGRYVADNDPGQKYAGFSSMADYQASLNKPAPITQQASPKPLTQQYIPQQNIPAGSSIGDVSAQKALAPALPTGTTTVPVATQVSQEQLVDPRAGQMTGAIAVPTAMATTTMAQQPVTTQANVMDAQQTAEQVNSSLDTLQASQTDPNDPRASVLAAQQTASSVKNLSSAQGNAILMTNPVQRQIQTGELIDGVANAEKASKYTEQVQAATATPTDQATVQGQLSQLTANFDATNPPSWAAGAIRGVQSVMQQRGIGASSIAGQALVQAAIESALPIAQADANTVKTFEMQNLSNRQQRSMLAAQQRATFIGQEFDQAFQARVQNASRISDIANVNFNAEQQVALENSKLANTMNLNNLSNRQALVIAEASALANMDLSNLSNRQQASVQNAQNFLQMDMANLTNQQQTEVFKAQQRIQSLFTDQAAENASKQFNATSQNQTDQFFANLATQVAQYNATQANAQGQFNAGQVNTVERFNAELNNQRDQFNAQNQLVIAQNNAQWRRQIATADTVAVNRANELNANALLDISKTSYDNLWQYYADSMEWAWTSAENELDRITKLAEAQLDAETQAAISSASSSSAAGTAIGNLIGTLGSAYLRFGTGNIPT